MPTNVQRIPATVRDALLAAVAALDTTTAAPPPPRLYSAADRPFGLSPWTFRRWAAEGRLRCHRGPRGKLLAWEGDVKAAIEAEPYVPPTGGAVGEADPFAESVARGELEEAASAGGHVATRGAS